MVGIHRSKKETERLHQLHKPVRKRVEDDLPSINSGSEDEADEDRLEKGRKRRPRAVSISSMPGSLPGSAGSDDEMEFEVDNDEDDYQYEGDEEPADDAFDEDLLAAGEMKDVPFL